MVKITCLAVLHRDQVDVAGLCVRGLGVVSTELKRDDLAVLI